MLRKFPVQFLFAIGIHFFASNIARAETGFIPSWGFEFAQTMKAHALTKGSSDVVVAIIDTGADVSHPMLQSQLWQNPGETGLDSNGKSKATNGRDDDQNGYIDDVHGWNFADNSNRVTDTHGHGTHIAGIVAGGAPQSRLMILKYFKLEASGEVNQLNTIRAIEYAIRMNARIINYSAGGTDSSPGEEKAIAGAAKAGVLFVAAAGNERSNSDVMGFYPASYNLPNIVSVTAVDPLREVLPSSNYGRNSVDLAAPGKAILSALPGGKTGVMTGTSQATAFVSGVAALIMAENPELKGAESILPYLRQSATFSESLTRKTKTGGTINAYQSLVMKGADLTAFGFRKTVLKTMANVPILSEGSEKSIASDLASFPELEATIDELPFHTIQTTADLK